MSLVAYEREKEETVKLFFYKEEILQVESVDSLDRWNEFIEDVLNTGERLGNISDFKENTHKIK